MQEVSTEASRAVVASFFRALRAGDMDALRAAFAPDATWILRGGLPASGTWTGPDGIMDGFFPQIFGRLDRRCPWCKTFTESLLTESMPSLSGPTTPGPATAAVTTVTMSASSESSMGTWPKSPNTSTLPTPSRCSSTADTKAHGSRDIRRRWLGGVRAFLVILRRSQKTNPSERLLVAGPNSDDRSHNAQRDPDQDPGEQRNTE